MADVATMMARPGQPFPKPGGISTTHRDITEEKYRDLRRPRKIRFFANGNRYFKGKKFNITPHRYLSFNDLLGDLTGKLPGNVQLPYGVRQIFTPVTGRRVRDIEELQDGQSYVCAGFDTFKGIKYGNGEIEPWNAGKTHNHDVFDFDISNPNPLSRPYNNGFYPSRALRHSYPTRKQHGTFGSRAGAGSHWNSPAYPHENLPSKPKVVTVIRNGPNKPRSNVKILLNRRSVQSFEQLMRDIAEAFGPKWRNNKIRKLFNVKGREIQGVSDFFRDDEVFIGVGNDSLLTGEVQEILDELYPDSPYPKNLMKEWDKTKRRYQNTGHTSYRTKEETPRGDDAKIDSGLGSDADNTDDVIYRGKGADYYKAGKKKQKQAVYASHDEEHPIRIEQERMRASEDERERARRRMQKRLEADRRATDDERRKRGLVPLKPIQNPFRKQHESPDRRGGESDRDASPVELPRIRRKKHRVPKMDSIDEPKVIVVIKGDENQDTARSPARRRDDQDTARSPSRRKDNQETTRSPSRRIDDDHEEGRDTSRRPKADEEEERNQRNQAKTEEENNQQKHKHDDEGHEKDKHDDDDEINRKPKPKKQDDDENNRREKENEEPKPPRDEQKDKKKKKPKSVYKSKMERQVSNADHATEKYLPGKTLGDGNFAIVKQCKLINTNNEYAMKIIDKAKLKGKEHMIENEIEIMKLCNHPNIARLIEEYETREEIYLIMELVKGGDLFDAITQSVKFSEDHSSRMVSDLAQALFYLHSRGIVHRDLKPENLLVQRNKDSSITLKLADFGLAMEVKEQIYTVCGTPTYVAPEILAETGYGLEVDMWAIGVITYILLCGFPPFRSPDRKQTELFEFIKAGQYEFLTPYWDKISKSAKDLIRRLLIVDRKKRYTSEDVLCHPWVITQAGIIAIDDIETHRKTLRSDLESQAKLNRESYVRDHLKQG